VSELGERAAAGDSKPGGIARTRSWLNSGFNGEDTGTLRWEALLLGAIGVALLVAAIWLWVSPPAEVTHAPAGTTTADYEPETLVTALGPPDCS
jgi:hypothetical protein